MRSCGKHVYNVWVNLGKKCVRLSTVHNHHSYPPLLAVQNHPFIHSFSQSSSAGFPMQIVRVSQGYIRKFPQYTQHLLLPTPNKNFINY